MNEKNCDICRIKKRDGEEKRSLMNRLSRIEGQIRGVRGMLEEDAYCTDILVQISAISSALRAFSKELLRSHVKSCVTEDIKAGKEDTVDDLLEAVYKLMR